MTKASTGTAGRRKASPKGSDPASGANDGVGERRQRKEHKRKSQSAIAVAQPTITAAGRKLQEFLPLLPAEDALLRAVRTGDIAIVSGSRPQSPGQATTIRAEFIRFLALGGDDSAPVHEHGIQLAGAAIAGTLHLAASTVKAPLFFVNCQFGEILARATKLLDVVFINCFFKGILADSCRLQGELMIRDGSQCRGPIRLVGATIDGNLDFGGCRLYNSGEFTVYLDRVNVGGSLILNKGFRSLGGVRLINASVGGSIIAINGMVLNRHNACLTADGARVRGDVFLSSGFRGVGTVRLLGTVIDGDLSFDDATIRAPEAIAMNGRSLRVGAGFLWRNVREIIGVVSVDSAEISDLADDDESWLSSDHLILDGFRYERISGSASATDASRRIAWLKHQRPDKYGATFWPQPWEQLAKILREMGHTEDARLVAMEKQRVMRKLKVIGSRKPHPRRTGWGRRAEWVRVEVMNRFARTLHRLYGALAGYGYRPLRTFMLMTLFWVIATGIFSAAEARGLFVPSAPSLLTDSKFRPCGPRAEGLIRWTRCPYLPRDYTTFDPLMYSLDVILPLVDLKQEGDWEPLVRRGQGWRMWDGLLVRGIMWAEILFGWIGSLLIVSALGRLVQKD